jgi:hypothetical protein
VSVFITGTLAKPFRSAVTGGQPEGRSCLTCGLSVAQGLSAPSCICVGPFRCYVLILEACFSRYIAPSPCADFLAELQFFAGFLVLFSRPYQFDVTC